ncbi:HD domain-containing protein [Streptomyces sporangiiformans]|uniref:HD domain-containing protein n=1 Tax=Streptomyces sporangiiformans TaxID=2315329 RepID=A0A505DEB7_9ACTN|nr:HD domain-containing protein [Streptomyces sporangiiformans]
MRSPATSRPRSRRIRHSRRPWRSAQRARSRRRTAQGTSPHSRRRAAPDGQPTEPGHRRLGGRFLAAPALRLADRLHNMRTIAFAPPANCYRAARESLDVFAS